MKTEEKKLRAFPRAVDMWNEDELGMTLRDYFANSAMQSILVSNNYDNCLGNNGLPVYDFVAEQSYKLADAMLKQREL